MLNVDSNLDIYSSYTPSAPLTLADVQLSLYILNAVLQFVSQLHFSTLN